MVPGMSRGLSLFHPEHGVRAAPKWMPDTRFGAWFQRSATWKQYVVESALGGFERILGDRPKQFETVLDVPFWSRPDFGLREWLGHPQRGAREAAELQVVARRAAGGLVAGTPEA